MDGSLSCFLIAILIVGVLIFIAIFLTGKRGHHFDTEAFQIRFLKIENSLKKDVPVSYSMAIIEGDKLLDAALMEMGIPGKTMGDRLKRSGDRFSELNQVWRAHKLRNAIAHETDLEISYKQAQTALNIYKQALRDLGAI